MENKAGTERERKTKTGGKGGRKEEGRCHQ